MTRRPTPGGRLALALAAMAWGLSALPAAAAPDPALLAMVRLGGHREHRGHVLPRGGAAMLTTGSCVLFPDLDSGNTGSCSGAPTVVSTTAAEQAACVNAIQSSQAYQAACP